MSSISSISILAFRSFLGEHVQQARRVRLLIASSSRLDLPGEWVLPLYGLASRQPMTPPKYGGPRPYSFSCGQCNESAALAHSKKIK